MTKNSYTLPETGFIRIDDILKLIPIGKSTWWAGVKSGKYPKSIKLGSKTALWKVEDIRTLIESINNLGSSSA